MIARQFTEDRLAAVYDRFYPPERRADFAFYLPLALAARAVLDVGCGTGALLRLAREAGHTGRLCGLDPASGMLNQARGSGRTLNGFTATSPQPIGSASSSWLS